MDLHRGMFRKSSIPSLIVCFVVCFQKKENVPWGYSNIREFSISKTGRSFNEVINKDKLYKRNIYSVFFKVLSNKAPSIDENRAYAQYPGGDSQCSICFWKKRNWWQSSFENSAKIKSIPLSPRSEWPTWYNLKYLILSAPRFSRVAAMAHPLPHLDGRSYEDRSMILSSPQRDLLVHFSIFCFIFLPISLWKFKRDG
jgi:hypothetical protein